MNTKAIYRAGLYCCLSKDDDNRARATALPLSEGFCLRSATKTDTKSMKCMPTTAIPG